MQVYRSRGSLVSGWLCVGLGVILGVGGVMAATDGSAQQGIGFGTGLVLVGVTWYLRPSLNVTDEAVIAKNVVQTAVMPLSRIRDLSVSWSLEVHGDDGMTIRSFAAPTSRTTRSHGRPRDRAEAPSPEQTGHEASRPATMVYDAWQKWKAGHFDSHGDAAATPSATRSLDPIGLGLVVMSLAMGVVGVLG